jgi:hypothetical protein
VEFAAKLVVALLDETRRAGERWLWQRRAAMRSGRRVAVVLFGGGDGSGQVE